MTRDELIQWLWPYCSEVHIPDPTDADYDDEHPAECTFVLPDGTTVHAASDLWLDETFNPWIDCLESLLVCLTCKIEEKIADHLEAVQQLQKELENRRAFEKSVREKLPINRPEFATGEAL